MTKYCQDQILSPVTNPKLMVASRNRPVEKGFVGLGMGYLKCPTAAIKRPHTCVYKAAGHMEE